MIIGQMKIDEINRIDTNWSIIYILLFYLLIIFLFYSFIIGVLVENHN